MTQEIRAGVFRLPASADASLARIPQSHFAHVHVIRRQGTARQREFFFGGPLNEALRAAPPGSHAPARWKIQHIGCHVLNGTGPHATACSEGRPR